MADSQLNILINALWKGKGEVATARSDLRQLGQTAGQSSGGMTKAAQASDAMRGALRGLIVGGTAYAAGRALFNFGRESTNAAAAAGETASLIRNSLGPATDEFARDMEQIADATNRSAFELETGASVIIAMARNMGFAREEAADFSATMTQIAVDLGSFFNRAEPDVFIDIQSALAGSSETMQKYGIDVRETALQQAALRMGLVDTLGPLDRQTRATVILAEIQRQAADAMGDAERTADSFTNTSRGLDAAMTDLKVSVGEGLIPVLQPLTVWLTAVADQAGLAAKAIGNEYGREVEEIAESQREAATTLADFIDQGRRLQEVRGIWGGLGTFITGTTSEVNAAIGDNVREIARFSSSAEEFQANLQRAFGDTTYIKAFDLQIGSLGEVEKLYQELTHGALLDYINMQDELARKGREVALQNQANATTAQDYQSSLENLARTGREEFENRRWFMEVEARIANKEEARQEIESFLLEYEGRKVRFDVEPSTEDEPATLAERLFGSLQREIEERTQFEVRWRVAEMDQLEEQRLRQEFIAARERLFTPEESDFEIPLQPSIKAELDREKMFEDMEAGLLDVQAIIDASPPNVEPEVDDQQLDDLVDFINGDVQGSIDDVFGVTHAMTTTDNLPELDTRLQGVLNKVNSIAGTHHVRFIMGGTAGAGGGGQGGGGGNDAPSLIGGGPSVSAPPSLGFQGGMSGPSSPSIGTLQINVTESGDARRTAEEVVRHLEDRGIVQRRRLR